MEAVAVALAAKLFFQMDILFGLLLGFVLAAVSPAVVVPAMLEAAKEGSLYLLVYCHQRLSRLRNGQGRADADSGRGQFGRRLRHHLFQSRSYRHLLPRSLLYPSPKMFLQVRDCSSP